MSQRTNGRLWALAASLWVVLHAGAAAQAAKRPLPHEAYDTWRSIEGTTISRDGSWVAYALAPQDGDGELVARHLTTDREFRQPRGSSPVITADNRFVVFSVAPSKADLDSARKDPGASAQAPPKRGLGILDLSTGAAVTVPGVRNFKLAEDSGRFVAYLLEPTSAKTGTNEPEKPDARRAQPGAPEPGADLVVRDLASGKQTTIPEVAEYTWNKPGTWLAYTVASSAPTRNGAFAWRGSDGTVRPLLDGQGRYQGLVFDNQGGQLAFISDRQHSEAGVRIFRPFLWATSTNAALDLTSTSNFPTDRRVSEHGKLEFSGDGARLFLGTVPLPGAERTAVGPIDVTLWTSKDPELQSVQQMRAEEEKRRSYRAMIDLRDRRFVQLAAPDMPSITVADDPGWVLGSSALPYRLISSWEGNYADFYAVSLRDGSRRMLIEKGASNAASLSPGGRYVLYFDERDHNWYTLRMSDGQKVNLTGSLGVRFENETWDQPGSAPPYGLAGWAPDDEFVLLYDRYDIWQARPDGGARMVTNGLGRRERLVFRHQILPGEIRRVRRMLYGAYAMVTDYEPASRLIAIDRPLLVSATDEATKATGFYRTSPDGRGDPVRLVMLDKAFGYLTKARDADTMVFTLQRFEEFPDLWVSDGSFAKMRKITNANPQQSEYVWGRSELIDYQNADGKPLKAILTRPDDFDPSKKYPLMVFIYERLTDGLHQHIPPEPMTNINITRYISNGYIVLRPDIVYEIGRPGESALKCVVPAVRQVLAMGFIDPRRVGIQGHSWGAYEISYMITKTDIFRAVEAGGSPNNFVSAYNMIRWGSGVSRQVTYEKSQSRLGTTLWSGLSSYIENSAIFGVDRVRTPYLTIQGDRDDAVPWWQAIEYALAMRRLGKEAYMFVYHGEPHSLDKRENQKHWTVRMAEYFDYFLKDGPRPEWMDGIPCRECAQGIGNRFYDRVP